jgi:hypothetical protein
VVNDATNTQIKKEYLFLKVRYYQIPTFR